MRIQLPAKKGNPNTNPVIDFTQLVVVGANGSGKTRFGSKIEQSYLNQTHRISAQKSLSFPREVSPKSKRRAEKEFYYGYFAENFNDAQLLAQKPAQRWGGKFDTHLLNDYEKLMVLLQTDEYEEALNYKEGRINKPITKLDNVQRIWESVLPHRKLYKRAGTIEAYPTGLEHSKYNASEMSDGERVIFYLIGEAICAPKNCILIIDEPEMHIHKSLVKTLFDLIEIEREDCAFIYLTHDIDFAFTRNTATKIWAKSYNGQNVWDYEILDEKMPLPEQLYLEVLGSRKPVLFLEGDNSSIDYEIYQQIYSEYTLKPLGSCEKVIQSVKALNEQKEYHNIQSFGIIDRDVRESEDVILLNKGNIWVLDVAEVENLFLIENVVKIIAQYLGKDPEDTFDNVKKNLSLFFSEQMDSQIIFHYRRKLNKEFIRLSNFSSKNINEVNSEVDTIFSNIDKVAVLNLVKDEFINVIKNNDYDGILRLFNLKNALIPTSKVCELIGIKNKGEYIKLVLSILKRNDENSFRIKNEIKKRILNNASKQSSLIQNESSHAIASPVRV